MGLNNHMVNYAYNNFFEQGQMTLPAGDLLQVTELSIIGGAEVVSHTQSCDEITFVISGSGTLRSGDFTEKLDAGKIHYIRKGSHHHISADGKEGIRFFCVGFTPNFEEKINRDIADLLGERNNVVVSDNGSIKVLSDLMMREFYAWDEQSLDAVNRYLIQLLVNIYRILRGKEGAEKGELYAGGKRDGADIALYKMLRYIDREYINLKTVREISEALGYSEYYLSHLFKRKMGITIKEYLTRKKINNAAELMKTSRLSVEEVSEYFNFGSSHSFRRSFKQYMGVTPGKIK